MQQGRRQTSGPVFYRQKRVLCGYPGCAVPCTLVMPQWGQWQKCVQHRAKVRCLSGLRHSVGLNE